MDCSPGEYTVAVAEAVAGKANVLHLQINNGTDRSPE